MRKVVIGLVLGLLLVLGLGGTMASAHTHIDLPNGNCVDIPASQEGNAHHGIGIAKAHSPVLEGGWCP